jgi:hypothetical protein
MTEPITMLTDYVLGILALAFGYAILRKNRVDGQISRSLWAYAFLSLSLSTLVGGTYHGFQWQDSFGDFLWKITSLSMGLTSLFMTASIVCANCRGKTRRDWLVIVGIKFLLFAGLAMTSDDFLLVIADYGSAMLVILVIALIQTFRKTRPEAPWLAAGVGVSLIAASAQASGISLHEHFNHNDIFHLIQIPALYLFCGADCS